MRWGWWWWIVGWGGLAQDPVCAEAFDFAIYPSVTEVPAVYVMYYAAIHPADVWKGP